MTRDEFRDLFMRVLTSAAATTEARLGGRIPHDFLIELHSTNSPGRQMSVDEAVSQLYLDGDHFFRVIDTCIRQVLPDVSVAFVRISGHAPGPYERTWDPSAFGPFKLISAEYLEDQRAHSG